MKANSKILITILSWEDRFIKSFNEEIDSKKYDKLFLLIYKGREKLKEKNFLLVKKILKTKKVNHELIYLPEERVERWKKLEDTFYSNKFIGKYVTLDITTMKRETIWSMLSFLVKQNKIISYKYYRPINYNNIWLSREPDVPQLLFKHSGISEFGKKTALLILSGYDVERTRQLVNHYEPEVVILGVQKGTQFDNSIRNSSDIHLAVCKGQTSSDIFYLDAYSRDHGFKTINKKIKQLKNYNIIATSQGPKLSALSLYKAFLKNNRIALCYVPAKQYNAEYSIGVGEKISGEFTY